MTVRGWLAAVLVAIVTLSTEGCALFLVGADGLAQGLFVTHHVQYVVHDLESEPDLLSVVR